MITQRTTRKPKSVVRVGYNQAVLHCALGQVTVILEANVLCTGLPGTAVAAAQTQSHSTKASPLTPPFSSFFRLQYQLGRYAGRRSRWIFTPSQEALLCTRKMLCGSSVGHRVNARKRQKDQALTWCRNTPSVLELPYFSVTILNFNIEYEYVRRKDGNGCKDNAVYQPPLFDCS